VRGWLVSSVLGTCLVAAAVVEFKTSFLQSRVFSGIASELTYSVSGEPSASIRYPEFGPYNHQQGFSRLPEFQSRLASQGFVVARQAHFSPQLLNYVELGGNPPYREKPQTGLTVLDEEGSPLYVSRQPANIYWDFADIPPLVIDTLLFIENRELLAETYPRRNPAVEWDRLADALVSRAVGLLQPSRSSPGGSTLATQLEKYRYSPGGVTTNAKEKLRQMVSASVRAYQDGPLTTEAREQIVRNYINSTPLSGRQGFGEIHGVGDGLWAWYGIPFPYANQVLRGGEGVDSAERARVYKSVLSLLLSQRRPSYYLLAGKQELNRLADSYLRLLADAGVVEREVAEAALVQPLAFREGIPVNPVPTFANLKAITSVRTELLSMLGVENLYTLDRLDLKVVTSVATQVQDQVEAQLQRLTNPDYARAAGLVGPKLLREDQLDAVRYSVLLYESTPGGNVLRVQTDNLNMPFDMNDGSKLDLGSTAKLRTLISYLDIVETLYRRHARKSPAELAADYTDAGDPLSKWLISHLQGDPHASLREVLDAAMARTYSASPGERFFTAGGLHTFGNFERRDNYRVMTVAEAFNRSVNLVFIRMMRDIARFHTLEIPGGKRLLEDPADPRRKEYLARFADAEGSEFMVKFYREYRNLDEPARLAKLASRMRATAYRLTMAFRTVKPDAGREELKAFLAARLGDALPDDGEIAKLYDKYSRDNFNSNDRAYLAKVHPLELWLVKYLLDNPAAGIREALAASAEERQEAYAWLFKPRKFNAQNKRIRILLEQDAFVAIHRQWQRLGYPFKSLVASYATALGASADRPSALAELMGIIVNDGVRLPMHQLNSLVFAEGTPYETAFKPRPGGGQQVLSPELCLTVRNALAGIVESGTARRLNGVFVDAGGKPLPVGGKTGTGDHRNKQYAAGGRLISEQVVNRNALFTFFIGDHHFGVILAHVGGAKAKDFDFTSGLAAQILKTLQPALQPLIEQVSAQYAATPRGGQGPASARVVATAAP